jgi:hypothetical protein
VLHNMSLIRVRHCLLFTTFSVGQRLDRVKVRQPARPPQPAAEQTEPLCAGVSGFTPLQ